MEGGEGRRVERGGGWRGEEGGEGRRMERVGRGPREEMEGMEGSGRGEGGDH